MSDATLTVDDASAVGLAVGGGAHASLSFGGEVYGPDAYEGGYEVTPTESVQTLATANKALSQDVTVDAIPDDYVGSAIEHRDATDLTASGATVSVPAGYYEEAASKAVASGVVHMKQPDLNKQYGEVRSKATIDQGWNNGGNYTGSALILDKQAGTTITPTESAQVAVAQYRWTTGAVNVAAIPSDYVGSAITQRDATDLSAAGDTVSVPAGYYAASATKAVAAGSAAVANQSFVANPTIQVSSAGKITAAVSGSKVVAPTVSPGYVSSGGSGVVSVGGTNTQQLDTQAATTITPTTSQQTAVAAGKYTTGAVLVDPIPPEYVVPTGALSITANGTGIDVAQYAAVDVAIARPANDFLGEEAEKVGNIYSASYVLKDTGYNGWTPSTTAKAIVTTENVSPTVSVNLAAYEYYIRWLFDANIVYASGTTMKAAIIREVEEMWQVLAKRPSSLANIGSDNWNGNNCSTFFTAGLTDYYSSSGSRTYTWSASYGLYIGATAATFANSTSDSTTVTIKTPAINARCSSTYFSTTRGTQVDQDNTKMALKGELWRVKADTCPSRQMFEHAVDLYNTTIIT